MKAAIDVGGVAVAAAAAAGSEAATGNGVGVVGSGAGDVVWTRVCCGQFIALHPFFDKRQW